MLKVGYKLPALWTLQPIEASIDELDHFLANLDLIAIFIDLAIPKDELEGLVDDEMECPDTYVNMRVPSRNEVRDLEPVEFQVDYYKSRSV